MDAPPPLHELEAAVMAAVWDQREATVRSVATAVNAGGDRARAYTTILTVMQRLDAKGLLERRRHGKRDVYVAAIGREDYMRARSQVDVDALLAQYGDMAFAHFAQRLRELDPARRSALRRLAGDD